MNTLDDLVKVLEGIDDHVKGEMKDRLEKRAPVDTGDLRDSFSITDEGIVSDNDIGKIYALEYGHSSQAPSGFIRITAKEVPDIIEEYMREKLP